MTHVVRGANAENLGKATGKWSHAEGDRPTASGDQAHAEGQSTTASGNSSHAEGQSTNASAGCSHAEGYSTNASGQQSHAEGTSTIANATDSHAEGTSTQATAASAHAEGNLSQATAAQAHAEGDNCRANAPSTHAEGSDSWAAAYFSHAEGQAASANRRGEHAKASGMFGFGRGDAQIGNHVHRQTTTNATPSRLTASGSTTATVSGNLTNVLTALASRAMLVRIEAVARRTDVQGEMAGFTWEGLVGRDSTGSARIIGTPTTAGWSDAGAAAWTLTMSINTTDATGNYLEILATGEAAKTIQWVAGIYCTEVAG